MQVDRLTDKQTVQAGWFLRPDYAPNSECPQFGMPLSFDRCTPPRRWFDQNIPPSVVLLQQWHCRNRHRDKLQNLSPPSVLFESSPIFLADRCNATFGYCRRLSSVCLSVTRVDCGQRVQIFRNISMALDTLAIRWHPLKISRRSTQGNPSAGELKTRGVVKYSDFGLIDVYISETVQYRR